MNDTEMACNTSDGIIITHEQLETEIRNASISRLPAILQCAVMTCVIKGCFSSNYGIIVAVKQAMDAGKIVKEKLDKGIT